MTEEIGSFSCALAGIILVLMLAQVSEWMAELRRYFGVSTVSHEDDETIWIAEDETDGE